MESFQNMFLLQKSKKQKVKGFGQERTKCHICVPLEKNRLAKT
jgi:hypothetical protein